MLKFKKPHYLAYITKSSGSWLKFYRAAFSPRPKFVLLLFWTRSRGSAVSVVTGLRVGFHYRQGPSRPDRSGTQPVPSYSVRDMAAKSWTWPLTCIWCRVEVCVELYLHFSMSFQRYVLLNLFCGLRLLECAFLRCILFVRMLYDVHRHTRCDVLYY